MNRLSVGQQLGKYELLEQIGTTGLASVYRARDTASGDLVALKVIHAYFSEEVELLQPFHEEMARVQRLHHPNIVNVLGLEQEEDNTTAVVMEYMSWPTLKSGKNKIIPLADTITILRQVAEALDYAHSQGIVHRDLRPSNVFYDQEAGRAKVSDFGIIRLVEKGHALIRTTVNTPSPNYASPEQIQDQAPDPRNDVYALGVLAYELLTGELPYNALSPHTILSRQLTTTPTTPSKITEGLPESLDSVVLKAINRDMGERFETCSALAEAFAHAIGTEALERQQTQNKEETELSSERVDVPVSFPVVGSTDATESRVETIEPEAAELGRLFCPRCSTGNPASARSCSNCWGRLHAEPMVTTEEEQQLVSRYWNQLRTRKRRTWVATASTVAVILAWWTFNLIEARPPLPDPASNISLHTVQGDWAMAQRNNSHTGAIPGPSFDPDGTIAWTFKADGQILASPVVADGVVFVNTNDRRVVALDAITGDTIWEHPVEVQANSTPSVAADMVYVGTRDGTMLALDRHTGVVVWKYKTEAAIYGSATVVDGVIYFGSSDYNIYALDALTGEFRWLKETDSWVVASPTVEQGILIVGSQDREFYMLDANNGTVRLHVNMGSGIDGATTIVDGVAYFTTRAGIVVAFDYSQKDVSFQKAYWHIWLQLWVWNVAPRPSLIPGMVWAASLSDTVMGDLATNDGRLFASTIDGRLYALDLNTGTTLWKTEDGGKSYSSPIISGDVVIQTMSDGLIRGFDVATGEEMWRTSVEKTIVTSPVLAGGTLYVPTTDGHLFAIK
jgi:serine/threonine protein kinase/outer membrane protein assembly factor BamB